jgi:hypothetical protein
MYTVNWVIYTVNWVLYTVDSVIYTVSLLTKRTFEERRVEGSRWRLLGDSGAERTQCLAYPLAVAAEGPIDN